MSTAAKNARNNIMQYVFFFCIFFFFLTLILVCLFAFFKGLGSLLFHKNIFPKLDYNVALLSMDFIQIRRRIFGHDN